MNIIRGKQNEPLKIVVYGVEGVGKSTFAAQFPDPVFIDTEGSTGSMDVARTPVPLSFAQLMGQVEYFTAHPEALSTLVIDTADWAEKLAIEDVCAQNHWNGIEDGGYGRGYVYVSERYGKLLNQLDVLRRKGVNIVLTAHAQIRKFEQPDEMGAYDRWELKLSKKTAPMLKEWADMLLFANYKTYVIATEANRKKAKATGGTKRVMYTQHAATYDAKNRAGLAPELPFEYAQIAHVIPAKNAPVRQIEKEPAQADPAPVSATRKAETINPPSTPEAAPRTVSAPAETPPETPEGVPPELAALMENHHVAVAEVQAVVAQRGYYPADTPIRRYDPAFIRGVLIGAWPQVEAMILKNREEVPF